MADTFSDPDHLRDKQYKTPDNLMARVALYERFSSAGPSLQDVRLDAMAIKAGETVIDFGCGNGLIWRTAKTRNQLPHDLTLVDLSQGMLDDAASALSGGGVSTLQHDLNEPLVSDRKFDVACAFHMLYHMARPFEAMDEILRHVKIGGRAFVHLNAGDHLIEMRKLIADYEGDGFDVGGSVAAPAPQEAFEYWQPKFETSDQVDGGGELRVTEAGPLIDYILSIEALHGNRYAAPEKLSDFVSYVEGRVDAARKHHGALIIRGHTVFLKFEGRR